MNFKKILYLGMTVLTIGAFTACAGDEPTVTTTVKEEVKTEVKEETKNEVTQTEVKDEEVRDLGGLVVTLANWGEKVEPEEKHSAYEEALWEHRNAMMEKHNFKFEELALAPWNGMLELFSTSVLAGEPAAEIFRFHASHVLSAV
ncbi:hypothetical protein AN642_01635 [Epulopiscium sp. SCG-B10WGA-EpuloA2]|nr:hypothetical protein AN642_01635 [Epulopiscium sp. SCG-B10WGA-EpuloA2]